MELEYAEQRSQLKSEEEAHQVKDKEIFELRKRLDGAKSQIHQLMQLAEEGSYHQMKRELTRDEVLIAKENILQEIWNITPEQQLSWLTPEQDKCPSVPGELNRTLVPPLEEDIQIWFLEHVENVHNIEELADDSGDAIKMAWSATTTQCVA